MGYQLIADAAMLLHFGFLIYVTLGGFLAWRWPKMFWPHLVIAAYGLGIVSVGWACPLSIVENWGRVNAGAEPLDVGFINHYITGVLYPEEHLLTSRLVAAVVVAVSWAGAARLHLRTGGGQASERDRAR